LGGRDAISLGQEGEFKGAECSELRNPSVQMWPVLPAKWALRRFDYSAIYLLIAETCTPFLAQMKTFWTQQVSG